MFLFPSTRTDYLEINQAYAPLADVHVRRAISYAIDRAAIVKAILFGFGKPANSFMPPQVPYYDENSPGIQYNPAKAKAELAKSKYKNGFNVEMLVGAGDADRERDRPDPPAGARDAEDQREVPAGRHEHRVHPDPGWQVPARIQLLDDGHRRPGRARDVRGRPQGRERQLVLHGLQQPDGRSSSRARDSVRRTRRSGAPSTAKIQRLAAQDAFMGFLYYSPFRYATSDKVNGFLVYPLGNYHLEDVWLS